MVKKSDWTKEEDLKLLELFKLGLTSRRIGEKLNRTKGSIQKRIQMFKKQKMISEKDRQLKQIENKDIKRAVDRENTSFMSNRALIKSSMSAYKNNNRGDLVLDKEKADKQGFVYMEDMPKRYINQEHREFNKHRKSYKGLTIEGEINNITKRLEDLQKEVRENINSVKG